MAFILKLRFDSPLIFGNDLMASIVILEKVLASFLVSFLFLNILIALLIAFNTSFNGLALMVIEIALTI